jgi:membrane protease YdiL (CAAX protease family)
LFAPPGAGNILIAMIEAADRKKQNARWGLAVYFTVLFVGSGYVVWRILQMDKSVIPPYIGETSVPEFAFMYVPAVASIVARLTLREGFDDVSFRLGGKEGIKAISLAWAYPIAVGFLAYGTAWITGFAKFQSPLPQESHLNSNSAVANFLTSFVFNATLGTVVSCLSALGEEIGWRGYMLTRLFVSGVPKPVLVSGLIWAFWHIPLILSGRYASGVAQLSAMFFVVGTLADAYLAAYVRLRSGSIWPAVTYHGAFNSIIRTFDRSSVDTHLALGGSGWLTATIAVVVVLFITRGSWKLQERPGQPLILPSDPSVLTV